MEKEILTRQLLYDKVWAEPLTKVAERYTISDSTLRKLCYDMLIPTPGTGYWAKLAADKTVFRPRLPSEFDGKDEIVLYLSSTDETPEESSKSEFQLLVEEIENDPRVNLIVPQTLRSPDILITSTIEELKAKKSKNYNWDNRKPTLSIDVTGEHRSRAYVSSPGKVAIEK